MVFLHRLLGYFLISFKSVVDKLYELTVCTCIQVVMTSAYNSRMFIAFTITMYSSYMNCNCRQFIFKYSVSCYCFIRLLIEEPGFHNNSYILFEMSLVNTDKGVSVIPRLYI